VALLSTLVVLPVSPAQAHNELTSSTPSAGARLTAAPSQVRLVFNQSVEPGLTTVTLKLADGPTTNPSRRESGPAVIASIPSSASSAQAPGRSAVWKVQYRVVSADGHPISGSISFGVAGGRPSASAPVASPSAPTPAPADSSAPPENISATRTTPADAQGPTLLMLLVGGGGILLAVGAGVWLIRAKPKQGS